MSFCVVNDLKKLESVCKLTNNSSEVEDIVAAIRQGILGIEAAGGVADIRSSLTHLCYMTENLKHQADVIIWGGSSLNLTQEFPMLSLIRVRTVCMSVV